ncbi:hypothetical protein B4U79_01611, partial [Dinothrombium tinctorium]
MRLMTAWMEVMSGLKFVKRHLHVRKARINALITSVDRQQYFAVASMDAVIIVMRIYAKFATVKIPCNYR